jgi:hypothetical protein
LPAFPKIPLDINFGLATIHDKEYSSRPNHQPDSNLPDGLSYGNPSPFVEIIQENAKNDGE